MAVGEGHVIHILVSSSNLSISRLASYSYLICLLVGSSESTQYTGFSDCNSSSSSFMCFTSSESGFRISLAMHSTSSFSDVSSLTNPFSELRFCPVFYNRDLAQDTTWITPTYIPLGRAQAPPLSQQDPLASLL